MTTTIIIIAILIGFSAFFSSSETALTSSNKIRLKNYAEQGNKKASVALKRIESYDKTLTAILIGNNIVNIASSSLATLFFTNIMGTENAGSAATISTVVMTVIVLICGEILPKSLAKETPEKFALTLITPLSFIMLLLTPFTYIFWGIKKLVLSVVSKQETAQPSVTEEELKYIINEIEDEGVLEEQESDLVRNALEFDETTIGEILIPRVNMCAVSLTQTADEIKDIFLTERYSRLPVYEKTVDNISGIINYKDFVNLYLSGETDVTSIIQKPLFISEHKKISDVLKLMQKTKNHLVIVVDQYGGTEGMVTIEDILEELVGEIYDENDEENTDFLKIDEQRYVVSGDLSIGDLLENLDLPEDAIETECNSVGGFVMELLDHIPENGENVKVGIFEFRVVDVLDQKIRKVSLVITPIDEKNNTK